MAALPFLVLAEGRFKLGILAVLDYINSSEL